MADDCGIAFTKSSDSPACETALPVHSVLEALAASSIRLDPFPHLVIENCLPRSYYRRLAERYPSQDLIVGSAAHNDGDLQQNHHFDLGLQRALQQRPGIAPEWLDFMRYHASPQFLRQVLSLFGPAILATYPQLESRIGKPIGQWSSGLRLERASDKSDISLDCRVGIDTPTTRIGSVRDVDVDSPQQLFTGMLYFRLPDDNAGGGETELHRWRQPAHRRFENGQVSPRDAEHLWTIPYRANTFVLMLNTPDSLHAVSPRAITPHPRRLVSFVGEVDRAMPEGLFQKREKIAMPARKAARTMFRKLAGRG